MTEFTIIGNLYEILDDRCFTVINDGDIIKITGTERMIADLSKLKRVSLKVKGIIRNDNELKATSCHILAGER